MWLSDRRKFLFSLAALPLAGCGFEPAYGTRGQAQKLRNQVKFQDPTTRESFELVEQLERRLGPTQTATYQLRYKIRTSRERLAVTRQEITTGYNLLGTVDYTLTDLRNGKLVTQGKVSNFTTYSAISNNVATRAAQQDARKRLMVILADDIVTRLIATAGSIPA